MSGLLKSFSGGGASGGPTFFPIASQMRQLAPVGAAGGGSGPIAVNVMNAPADTTARVSQEKQPGGGMRIDVELLRVVDGAIANGLRSRESQTHRAMKDVFGVRGAL